jgi:hypothetical protein
MHAGVGVLLYKHKGMHMYMYMHAYIHAYTVMLNIPRAGEEWSLGDEWVLPTVELMEGETVYEAAARVMNEVNICYFYVHMRMHMRASVCVCACMYAFMSVCACM